MLDTQIYPVMPSCRKFIRNVAIKAPTRRALLIQSNRLSHRHVWVWVKEGLREAHCTHPIELRISEGMDIPSEIGPQLGRRSISAQELASLEGTSPQYIILRASSEAGRQNCHDFAVSFIKRCITDREGCVHLLLDAPDDEDLKPRGSELIEVINFSAAMPREEMNAYVTMRMIERSGPGTTQLLRALIAEFAGYDPQLAEHLMNLPADEVLSLPDSLEVFEAAQGKIWETASFFNGTKAYMDGHNVQHTLHLWHVARAGIGAQVAVAARRALNQMYWRACLTALLPWLEHRRHAVVEIFREELDQLKQRQGGALSRRYQPDRDAREIDEEDVDYNTLVVFHRFHSMRVDRTSLTAAAFEVCVDAKRVRDDIAHLRRPEPGRIRRLISGLDTLMMRSGNGDAEFH